MKLLVLLFFSLKLYPTICCKNDAQKSFLEQKRPNLLFAITDNQSFTHTIFAGKSNFKFTEIREHLMAELFDIKKPKILDPDKEILGKLQKVFVYAKVSKPKLH